MPKIVIENGPDKGRSYPVSTAEALIAGRDPSAKIPLRDEMASRRHFEVAFQDGRFVVRDLESKNGVTVNGKPLEGTASLSSNDRIQVGETLLTFVGDDPHPLLGREVSGYRIEDRIGRGGMGTVYRALQLSLDRTVAMKILAPHLVENQSFINLFIREARAAGALSHPNLVQVYDVGVEEDIYFYSMEYIPHGSVEELLNRDKQIAVPRALEIVRDAALGLQYAELKGLVHRDIKPGNLMIGADDIIKIGDLGIARFGEEEGVVSQKDGVSGSPHYIAPEQARGLDIDHRADLYALGVSFYQMLCGKTPYRGSTPREVILGHLKTDPPPLAERAPDVPAPVIELVESMMQKDRDERIASATAVLERLDPLLRRYKGDGDGSFTGTNRSRLPKLIGGLTALCIVSVGITLAVLHHQSSLREEEERVAEYTEMVEGAEGQRGRGELAAVATSISTIKDLADLPEDLMARVEALEQWLDETREAEERAAREQYLAEAFSAAEEEAKPLSEKDAVAHWQKFIDDHPDSEQAAEATRRKEALESSIREREARERTAELRLRPIIDSAERLASDGNYKRALATLDGGEEHPNTPAENDRSALRTRIESDARDAWARCTADARASITAGEFTDARAAVRRFRAPDFLAGEIQAFHGEIDTAERAARESANGGTTEKDTVAIALNESLTLWATLDERGKQDEVQNSYRDAVRKLGLELIFDAEEKRTLQRAIDQMKQISGILDEAGRTTSDQRISITTASGTTMQVRVQRFTGQRVTYRKRGASRNDVVDWYELTPTSRFAVIQTATALPEGSAPAVGWLYFALGESGAAEELWTQAETSSPALIAALRALAGRAVRARTND